MGRIVTGSRLRNGRASKMTKYFQKGGMDGIGRVTII